jgi:hypothetical protein
VTGPVPHPNDLPEWPADQFRARTPLPVVPVPAYGRRDLRGSRVIIGVPGIGWRGDLRADAPVVQGSRTFIPVLSEHEWYRAEAEETEVFAPLVPVERVWLETIAALPGDPEQPIASLDAPPPRYPVPAGDVTSLVGRRLVQPSGPEQKAAVDRRDLRAVTEAYADARGGVSVRVAAELDWYRWAWSGKAPKTLEVDLGHLWVE